MTINKKNVICVFCMVVLIATLSYYFMFVASTDIFDWGIKNSLFVLLLVIAVHLLKSLRLYIILYGTLDIDYINHLKLYTLTTPVSVILPYKVGEVFRIVLYGNYMNDYIKGSIIILLDRFIDTVALIVLILSSFIIYGGQISFIVFFLLIFTCLLILSYLSFKSFYLYWNKRVIKSSCSKRGISFLKHLKNINNIYEDVHMILKGKGMILLFISLLSWIIELFGLMITIKDDSFRNMLIIYIQSIIGRGNTVYNKEFVFFSVVILVMVFIVVSLLLSFKKILERD